METETTVFLYLYLYAHTLVKGTYATFTAASSQYFGRTVQITVPELF